MLQALYTTVVGASFGASLLLWYALLSAPVEPPRRLGLRGLERVRAARESPLFARLDPLLRGLGRRLRPLLSEPAHARLDRRLMLAGDWLGLLPEELVALSLLSGAAVLALGGAYAFLAQSDARLALAAAVLFGLLPNSRLDGLRQERQLAAEQGLPPIVDLLVLGLSAGLDLPGALRQVVEKSSTPTDPLIRELEIVLQELQVGKTRRAALEQLAERLPTAPVRELTGAIIAAEQHGSPLARVLEIHAEVSRRERSTRAEEAAAKAGVKMMVPLMMVFVATLILMAGPMFLSADASLTGGLE